MDYLFSQHFDGTITFSPGTDRLIFDNAATLPTDVVPGDSSVDGVFTTRLDVVSGPQAGKFIVLTGDVSALQLTTANWTFASGGVWVMGDNQISRAGDNLDNTLTGSEADDTLAGVGGNDLMNGLGGNDVFYLSANGPSGFDTVNGGAGIDTLNCDEAGAALAVNLAANTLSGGSTVSDGAQLSEIENFIGGNFNDSITGSAANNVLEGRGGNDSINGGAGNDTMIGGTGNDTYFVAQAGDRVTELSGQGVDTIKSSVTYTLAANVEKLILTGTNNVNGTGSGGNNVLTGNAGNNMLDGKGGNDALNGMDGNDTMIWNSVDSYDGGAGTDALRVLAGNLNFVTLDNSRILNVEIINLTGGGNNVLTLNTQDVLDLSSTTNTLKVLGDAGDSINIVPAFSDRGEVAGGFHKYTLNGTAAILLVDTDITNVA